MPSQRIRYDTNLQAAADNAVCLSQSPAGAGNMLLNGAQVSGGIAVMDSGGNARQVLLTFAGNEAARTFIISGKVLENGAIVTETVAGTGIGTTTSVNYFLTITSISIDAASAGAIKVGTNGVGASPWKAVNSMKNPFQMAIFTILRSGAVNWTIQHTGSDVFNGSVLPIAFDHSVIAAKAANTDGNYAFPPIAVRTKINSGTGTVGTELVQSQNNF